MATLVPLPKFQFLTDSGDLGSGYMVATFEPGTSTPKDTYTTADQSVANTNPVILDSRGESDIWFDGLYNIRVSDNLGVEVYSVDDFGADAGAGAGAGAGDGNFIANGGFESVLTGNVPENWDVTRFDSATSIVSIDSVIQSEGLRSLAFTSVGQGGGFADSTFAAVRGGMFYKVDYLLQSSVTNIRNVVEVRWYDDSQTFITSTIIYDSELNPTAWTRFQSVVSVPTNARFAKVRITGCHSSNTLSGQTWFDDVRFTADIARLSDAQQFSKTQSWSKGVDVASSSTLTLGDDGNYFDITGVADISSIATKGVGTVIKVHFDSPLTLLHHAVDLVLPGGADIVTSANDEAEFVEYSLGNWRCVNYSRFSGRALSQPQGIAGDGISIINTPTTITVKMDLTTEPQGTHVLPVGTLSSSIINSGFLYLYNPSNSGILEARVNSVWRPVDPYVAGSPWTAIIWSDGENVRVRSSGVAITIQLTEIHIS